MLSPSAETLLIRPMQDEDLEQVLAIDQASFALPWPASAYRFELRENPGSQSWVAETRDGGGQPIIVGLCVVWLILEEAHIATIAVHPEYRGRGIGQVILSAALLGAMRRGCSEATLEVRAGNLPAQRLYQRFGFQLAGIRPRYYRDNNEDAWIMTVSNLGPGYQSWLENEGWRSPAA